MKPRDLLGKIDLFKDLSVDQLSAVAPLGGLVSVKAGEELAGEDESTQSLFNIIKGEARLSFQTRTGEISVRDVGPGDSFPLAALLESGSLITTGKALTDMEVLVIPISPLLELCATDTELGMRVFKSTARLFAHRYGSTLGQLAVSAERELRVTGYSTEGESITCIFCGKRGEGDVDLYPVGQLGNLQPVCNRCVDSWIDTSRKAASLLEEDAELDQQGRG